MLWPISKILPSRLLESKRQRKQNKRIVNVEDEMEEKAQRIPWFCKECKESKTVKEKWREIYFRHIEFGRIVLGKISSKNL